VNDNLLWLRTLLHLSELVPGSSFLFLPMFVLLPVSGSIRLRSALMVLLSVIKLVSLLAIFSRIMVVTMMRLLLMSLAWPLFGLFLRWPLLAIGLCFSFMLRIIFLMVSCVRRFICTHHLGILSHMAWYAVFVALSIALSKPLVHSLSTLLLWSHLMVALLFFCMLMT
jgi:hypothetical protein